MNIEMFGTGHLNRLSRIKTEPDGVGTGHLR
jgi:hypothetical protein